VEILGIDIGGTGIKGAPVNIEKGRLVTERFRLETPKKASPKDVVNTVAEVVKHFQWKGPVGCTLPSVVIRGEVLTAANIDKSWIGLNAESLLGEQLGTKRHIRVLNDADAAGIAEMQFGAGRGKKGLVIMVTLGTGIGSALFFNGVLVPNSEIGHLELDGKDAELRASNRVREDKDLSWKKWGKRVNEYLLRLEALLWPEYFIIGGGVSKEFSKYGQYLETRADVLPAMLLNDAGIVGAALEAGRG
jgi:polyphosphate glucokinase